MAKYCVPGSKKISVSITRISEIETLQSRELVSSETCQYLEDADQKAVSPFPQSEAQTLLHYITTPAALMLEDVKYTFTHTPSYKKTILGSLELFFSVVSC